MTDEQILVLIRNRSSREQGYRQLMNRYQEMMYQHIRRIVRDHEDTNDVLQNTFIKVFKHIDKFEGRSSLYTWMFRIATNEALSHQAKRKRMQLVDAGETKDTGLENSLRAEKQLAPETIGELLTAALESLPDKQKSVFNLRYYEEMSYRQMSELLGTSEGALKASFHHAVKKIENYFKTVNIY